MKKVGTLVLMLCMTFGLAACGTNGNADKNPASASGDAISAAEAESKTVALCENWDFESGFFTPIHLGNSTGHGVSYYLPNMYETLVQVSNGEIVPALVRCVC